MAGKKEFSAVVVKVFKCGARLWKDSLKERRDRVGWEIGSVIFFYLSWTLYRAYTWYHMSRVVETYNFLIGIPKAWVPS